MSGLIRFYPGDRSVDLMLVQQIIYGATILIAVAVYSREARLRDQI